MFVKNVKTLQRAIKRYGLRLVEAQSTSGYGGCARTLVYLRFARGGQRAGVHAERNQREIVTTLAAALPLIAGRRVKFGNPDNWLLSQCQ
jgi:hypothetical protein